MFDKVVFAGGGHRCWWQAGFWEQVSGEIELHPRVIGAVSSGAFTACMLYGSDTKRALAWYERELKGVRSNINWLNLLRRGQPLLPHAAIFRKALRALLGGENFRQLMWRAPEIRVQYARLPPGMSPARAVLGGMVANRFERYWHGSLHPTGGRRMGLTHEVRRVQDCRSERELIDLLVASSCSPPFTPVELIDGLPCVDGGLVDDVPIGLVADVPGQTLVITTRRYRSRAPVFARDGLLYVQPSEAPAASSWDCTSPARFQKTYDLGRRDGEEFLKSFALGRHHEAGLRASVAVAAGDDGDEVRPTAPVEGAAAPAVGAEAAPAVVAAVLVASGARDAEQREEGTHFVEMHAVEPVAEDDLPAAEGASGEPAMVVEARVPRETRRLAKDGSEAVLDVSAKLANYREPTDAGIAEDLSASQPAASDGQERSGRSLRASNI